MDFNISNITNSIVISTPCAENCTILVVESQSYNNGQLSSLIFQTYGLFACLCILSKNTLVKLPTLELISEVVIINLTVVLIFPVLFGLFLIIFTVRSIAKLYIYWKFKGKIQLVKNSDSFWACDSYINTNYVYAQVIAEGNLTIEQFKEKMSHVDKLSNKNFERMKCKITKKLGFFCWEFDDKFDLSDHIREIPPIHSSCYTTERDYLEQIGHLYDHPMPDNRPKWEIHFIPNFRYESNKEKIEKKNYYSFVWKFNHVYMDGVSVTNTLNHFIADHPVKMAVDPFKPLNITWYQWILIYIKLALMGPHSLAKALFVKEDHCFHGPKLTGPKSLRITKPIKLEALKAIKDVKGTTISALLIAVVGGAIRRLALRKGLPVPQTIHTAVTSALIPYDGLRPTNRFTIAHMPISIGSDESSKRLQSAIKSAYDLSRSVEFLLNFQVVRFVGLFPAGIIKWFIDQTHCSLIFSNVPGPREPLVINGKPIKDLISWNVIKGTTGLGVCLISYGGRINAGLIGDAAVFTDKTDMDSLVEEYENEMVDLALASGIPESSIFAGDN